ncbi:hypothetical protein [Loktanella sp. IMCC34160]|uniref:hypothetical protein n=1 Tax=Loktanella sp. IMCC34160 TaxID=2510646 RepID=UPI0013EA0313|nr:hypothetical protein [Loktanella sp. IMCC34160]
MAATTIAKAGRYRNHPRCRPRRDYGAVLTRLLLQPFLELVLIHHHATHLTL